MEILLKLTRLETYVNKLPSNNELLSENDGIHNIHVSKWNLILLQIF